MNCSLMCSVALFVSLFIAPYAIGQKLKPEEVIAKHLASIAPAEKLSSIKSMIAVGEVSVENKTRKDKPAIGRIVITSEGNKMFFGMRLNMTDYPQEIFVFDGAKTDVAIVRDGTRSPLGNFIQSNNAVMSQGLMSGTLKTSWALLAAAEKGAKISSAGNKKIDGREVYALNITPKGANDLDITMYFDQQTFQHVRTEYKRTVSASVGRTVDDSARQSETRLKVTEDFSDHKEYKGITIPSKYKINYVITGQAGTTEITWTCDFSEFAFNQPLDPGTFAISK